MVPTGAEYLYVEKPSMELLEQLGWTPVDAFHENLGSEGTLGRDSQHDVILTHRLRSAMRKLAWLPSASVSPATPRWRWWTRA